jgi:N-carbamoylputrescine amidase
VSRELTVGLAQVTGRLYAPDENRRMTLDACDELLRRGADIVVLPELISSGYGTDRDRLLEAAEPMDGPTTRAWAELAARSGSLVAAGICERDGDALYNAAVLVGADGVLLHYRKLHLFAGEKRTFSAGDLGLPVAETDFGVIGLCVCYDLRFVETLRALALQGAELVAVPTAWLPGFDRESWDAEGYAPQARGALLQANLDQTFVACASQVGDNGELKLLGSSLLCDPYGKPALGPLARDREDFGAATLDLDEVGRAQERDELIRPRADRRTDVYGLSLGGRVL